MLTLREIQRVPEKHAGPVTIGGWAKTIRTGKSVGFIELNDGTCFKSVQVVFPNDERNMGKDLSTGCSVRVTGQLVLTPDAPSPLKFRPIPSRWRVPARWISPCRKAPHAGVSAHAANAPPPNQHLPGGFPGAQRGLRRHS